MIKLVNLKPQEPVPPGTYKVVLREIKASGNGKYEILDGPFAGRYIFGRVPAMKVQLEWREWPE